MADFRAIADALKAGNAPKVKEMVEAALAEGVNPEDIVNNALIGMGEIGNFSKTTKYMFLKCWCCPGNCRTQHIKAFIGRTGCKAYGQSGYRYCKRRSA